ncbi:hypothetical protein AGABI1DRAFT_99257 [Agaricus bisporus var. burnettii JB137-S8]|uniref:Secreted protein n=1 Tax=Agaricus bisporus var. burnettii (strain JB137-S8 / ATCC MYA-4627 / FGSC 10392) TaxID=597362 RepID=K5XCY2_AGABU|nr:uncharacterized protein AGABI1DRAFT_99257 [Agaricus bisporus var. burnettii JB137-S8]EKM81178.1 hypothetical protein AGABI1DRAFT_99257 [Agaricus bisporus var. burnettii JB137-S8]
MNVNTTFFYVSLFGLRIVSVSVTWREVASAEEIANESMNLGGVAFDPWTVSETLSVCPVHRLSQFYLEPCPCFCFFRDCVGEAFLRNAVHVLVTLTASGQA